MKLTLRLITVGNSVGFAIPKDVLETLELKLGERVEIEIKEGK